MSGASSNDNNSSVLIFQGRRRQTMSLSNLQHTCQYIYMLVFILLQYPDQQCKRIRRKYTVVNFWHLGSYATTEQIIDSPINPIEKYKPKIWKMEDAGTS